MTAVDCSGLVVRYGTKTAVDGLSLRAEAGEVVVLLGPNGAGKTSTVESLEGYRKPAAGRVRVLGLDPVRQHDSLVGRIGVMLQRGGLYPMLGPRRAVRLFASYYADAEDPDTLLDLLGLRDVAGTPWRHLSGGEQQRLSLALALVGKPEVVFLDEPTSGVDPEGRLAIRQMVEELRHRNVCVLLSTHELAEAEQMADRVVIIHRGRTAAEGTPEELAAKTGGGSTVSFGAPRGLDTAALAAALGASVSETAPGRYRVQAPGSPALTATLAGWLADRDTTLTDLRAGGSLEEAYLAVVRAPRAEPGPDPPPSDGDDTGAASNDTTRHVRSSSR